MDDFVTAGPPQSSQCAYNLNTAVSVCHPLGLPLHANKCVGPATSMTILGIELDSVNQVARLPEDKLVALRELIRGSLVAGAESGNWSPLLAIYTMLLK